MLFVIEHLEPKVSKWLYYEYEHASRIVGKDRLMFTNVKREGDVKILSSLGTVRKESFIEIFDQEKIVILDPQAEEELKPKDLEGMEAIIIGGILGDHPPRGRTKKLITSRAPKAIARNIGKEQFSIDGAVYVARMVSEGCELKDIPVKVGLVIKISDKAEIYLPYAYPLRDGKPVVSEDLLRYLASEEIVKDEEELLRGAYDEWMLE